MEKTQDVKLPLSLMTKLYDATGANDGSNKGYFLFFVDENGVPALTTKTSNACANLALHQMVESYLDIDSEQ